MPRRPLTVTMGPGKLAKRKQARGRRDALSLALRQAHSARIVQHLTDWLSRHPERLRIGVYMAMNSEVDLSALELFCRAHGRSIYAPRITDAPYGLDFVRFDDATTWRCAKQGYKVPEGVSEHPSVLDVVLVPGLAFDARGYRLGYGGGHYDRALQNLKACRLGVCFSVQRVEQVPCEPHDVMLDGVVDEAGLVLRGHVAPQAVAPASRIL